ncbi:MAG TPA: PQQ-binding-like beta-propeller repeat protein [Flavitalea sp.]|nr:PQQ-binding-like beta-propeller repeat protein [Flavitalea sp.]
MIHKFNYCKPEGNRSVCSVSICLLAVVLFFIPCQSQVTMFRGSPDHAGYQTNSNDFIIGEEKWKMNIDVPVRASVIVEKGMLFIGASNGTMYALNEQTGSVKWKFQSGAAIHSTAAFKDAVIYFTNNQQALFAVESSTGKIKWKMDFGTNLNYPWAFDYFYSSPVITDDALIVGIKDGYVYNVNLKTRKVSWKYKTQGIVRSSPAVKGNTVYFGDTEGFLYAVNKMTGAERWRFAIDGHSLKNEDFGFDRRAIISSPVVTADKVIFGGRDGFLYAVDTETGREVWRNDHKVSWVISSVAVKDSVVVTGTSDGRFVQGVNLKTGQELWRFKTISIVWSSPVIQNNKVYIGSQEGVVYCLDLHTGNKLAAFQASGRIFPSPVIHDSLLFFGTDNGYLYALKPLVHPAVQNSAVRKFVFWEPGINIYFRPGIDVRIRDYLNLHDYKTIDTKQLTGLLEKRDSATNSVIVFASNFFPGEITQNYHESLLRRYLDAGGKVVILGNNPMMYITDPVSNQVTGRNFLLSDSVLNTDYRYADLRAFRGFQPAFPTEDGRRWGLTKWWVAPLSLPTGSVDIVLGKDENGLASAWVKKFHPSKGSGFVQIWIDPDGVEDLSQIIHVAEYWMQ